MEEWFAVGDGTSGGPGAATMDRPVTPDGDGESNYGSSSDSPARVPTRWLKYSSVVHAGSTMSRFGASPTEFGQVVLVASGYDCRALRFRTPGVRFIELDHPDTQTTAAHSRRDGCRRD